MSKLIRDLTQNEQLNFLLTNRVPRHGLTKLMGWFSHLKSPLLTTVTLYFWKIFAGDLKLQEARLARFNSLHECFIRELKEGARPLNMASDIVVSPCDAIIGSCGQVDDMTVYQAKGFPYEIGDLIPDQECQQKFRNGTYVTLRLKSTMYHRFHAPLDCSVSEVNYISGDTWNVNPIALKRIEKLYCKNERAIIELNIDKEDAHIALVPVAAILVASMKFHCIEPILDLAYRGPNKIACSADYKKGDEMGYFQHGSTIIVFASEHYLLLDHLKSGDEISMGQALLKLCS